MTGLPEKTAWRGKDTQDAGGDMLPWFERPEARFRIYAVLAIFSIWILCSWIVTLTFSRPQIVLPYPWQVIAGIKGLAVYKGPGAELTYWHAVEVILVHSFDSAVRLVAGLAIGGALGLATGLLLGMSKYLQKMFQTPLLLIRAIPLFALIPLFLTWFGGTNTGVVSYIAFGVFSMLLVNTIAAIRNVSPLIQNFARTLGASRWRVYRTVVFPAIVPEITGGIRVIVGIAWAILIGAELLAAPSGVGRILTLSEQYSATDRMILIVMLIMIYTLIVDYFVIRATRYLNRWSPSANNQH